MSVKNNQKVSRRGFISISGAAAAGAAALSIVPKKINARLTGQAWTDKMAINPDIDNLRVVCCHDTDMISGTYGPSFTAQNAAIDAAEVGTNMDLMAMALAQKTSSSEAWSTIFRKPDAKQWSAVRCAIKVNCIEPANMPRVAIVGKICEVLISLGVPAANVVVFDGDDNADGNDKYTPFIGSGLPNNVLVSNYNASLGGMVDVNVNGSVHGVTADLGNGLIDILINVAVNKNHGSSRGSATLCMKNHFGTFAPRPAGHSGSSEDQFQYLINTNKHDAIVGGSPARQQLCIMDSLWAMQTGPRGAVTHEPARIAMGTFGPAVDYLTAYKIRADVMNITNQNSYTDRFVTEFGYTNTERDALDFINVDPTGSTVKPLFGKEDRAAAQSGNKKIDGTYTITGQKVSGGGRPKGIVVENGKRVNKK